VSADRRFDAVPVSAEGIELQIRRLGAVLSVCFVIVALGVGYWGVVRAQGLVARTDNPRLIEAERRIRRGDIFDRWGRPLARSEPGANGVWNRVYPATEAAPVVGYSSINHGTGGIEAAYDVQIRGEQPMDSLDRLAADLLHLHTFGISLTLTLDREVQRTAYEEMGIRSGAIVVLDVQSGDIVAMVSKPTFDPNTLEEDWPLLQYSLDKRMLNRAAQGLYPPGLVFETITLAAVLEEGLVAPATVFTDELGVVLTVDPPISCPSDPPQAHATLAEAYTWPCSVLFARLGLQLGGERLADYATQLGVGRSFDLPIDVSSGQLLERGMWSDLNAARTAMGRGEVLVTPLEMALVAATLANDGRRPAPGLVLAVGDQPYERAGETRQVVRPEVARQVRDILSQAYETGRRSAALPAASVAGRAGSAESGVIGAPPHSWFIGLAPRERPRYAIAVIVEHGSDGWRVAAPIAVEVLGAALSGG